MNDYILLVIINILTVPLAYFTGYKLRKRVSKERRFAVGFAIAVSVLAILFFLSFAFPWISRPIQVVATAVAIGLSLGIALPLYNDSTK